MLSNRAAPSCTASGSFIYVFGGYDRYRLRTAEVYDMYDFNWTRLTNMENYRAHFCAVNGRDENYIFVLGGKFIKC